MKQRIESLDSFINEANNINKPTPFYISVGNIEGNTFVPDRDPVMPYTNATIEYLQNAILNLDDTRTFHQYEKDKENKVVYISSNHCDRNSAPDISKTLVVEMIVSHYVNFFSAKGTESINMIGVIFETKGLVSQVQKYLKVSDIGAATKILLKGFDFRIFADNKLPSGNLNTQKNWKFNLIKFNEFKKEIKEPK